MNVQVAMRAAESVPPIVAQMMERARQLEAQGRQLAYLLRGEPDFDTPAHIAEAAIQALRAGQTHYTPTQGISELRQAVARRMERDFALALNPEAEIIATTGATMGIYIALQAIVNPGDEIILFDPVYDPYPTIVGMAGGKAVRVRAEEQDGHFFVPLETLEKAINSRTKAILINNPWNPTGTVMTVAELNCLIDLAEAHDLILIADEIYEAITFDERKHRCLLAMRPSARERIIIVNSFSKSYAMTGWRIGYNIASPTLTEAMGNMAQQFSRSAATFVQWGAVAALGGPQTAVAEMVSAYNGRRQLMLNELQQLEQISFHAPEGTFFFFLNIRSLGMASQRLADYLLEEGGVVTIPGSAYGPAGEGFIRLSFAYHDAVLQQGLTALVGAIREL